MWASLRGARGPSADVVTWSRGRCRDSARPAPLRQSPQNLLTVAPSEGGKFSQLLCVNSAPSSAQWPLAAMAPPPPPTSSPCLVRLPSSRSAEAERRPTVVGPSQPIKAAPPLVPLSITVRPRLTILVSYYSNTRVCGALSTPLPVRVT